MTSPEIEQKLKEIISKKFDVAVDTIGPETRLVEDLKMDSFGAVEFMFELEEAFGLSIPDREIERVRRVRDIVGYLSENVGRKVGDASPDAAGP